MKVTAFIRSTSAKNNTSDKTHVFFRVRDGKTDIKAVSELSINPNHWSAELQGYKPRVSLVAESKRLAFDKAVHDIKNLISEKYYRGADGAWLKSVIEEYHHPNINKIHGNKSDKNLFTTRIIEYADNHPMETTTSNKLKGIARKVERFERYKREILKQRGYVMNIDLMTVEDLKDLQDFVSHECVYFNLFPKFYEDYKITKPMMPLCDNSLRSVFRKLRTVVNWCIKNKYTQNDPFATFEMPKDIYDPPFYLTLEERDKVYYADLSDCPDSMRVYRDIFMLQCMIGCRVGDLHTMMKANVVNGAIEYIARKTKHHQPRTIRVPLNEKAKAIIAMYEDVKDRLVPEFNFTRYNENIRKILKHLKINRKVVLLNKFTHEQELKPICDVATSHTARKTFIGNLYKKVKDPALVASLSGHTDGSRAFARYREIDMEMKQELVGLID